MMDPKMEKEISTSLKILEQEDTNEKMKVLVATHLTERWCLTF